MPKVASNPKKISWRLWFRRVVVLLLEQLEEGGSHGTVNSVIAYMEHVEDKYDFTFRELWEQGASPGEALNALEILISEAEDVDDAEKDVTEDEFITEPSFQDESGMSFRVLSSEEEQEFRKWARENDTPEWRAKASILHPVVRDEWRIVDESKRKGNGNGHRKHGDVVRVPKEALDRGLTDRPFAGGHKARGWSEDRERHVQMMASPDNWPVGGMLPLKNIDRSWNTLGLLLELPGLLRYRVFVADIFTFRSTVERLGGDLSSIPYEQYSSYVGIYEAGWRVD